ncbi:MAG: DUF4386 family protein [Promethearchaeota archaeon]|nr:MAG: DUF4386 family protein [Candidatus Lokiarchaeota archaeon]
MILIRLSGFLFLFIIITNLASERFGYKTFGDVDLEAQLQKINNNPIYFKISIALILLEHLSIISLAITLFLAFGNYNIILGIIWFVSRIGEGLIQIYDKKNYWRLFDIADEYSNIRDAEKEELIKIGIGILKTKSTRFAFAQILFSIGTLAYSILFATHEIIPMFIGWFGILASIVYGVGNLIFQIMSKVKVLWKIGGLLILFFEIILGGWLLFFI